MKEALFSRVLQEDFFSLVVDIAQTIKNRDFNYTHTPILTTKKKVPLLGHTPAFAALNWNGQFKKLKGRTFRGGRIVRAWR